MLNKLIATTPSETNKKEELKIIIGYLLSQTINLSALANFNQILDKYSPAQLSLILKTVIRQTQPDNPAAEYELYFSFFEKILGAIQELTAKNSHSKKTEKSLQELNKFALRILMDIELPANIIKFYFNSLKIFITKNSAHYLASYYLRETIRKEALGSIEQLINNKKDPELLGRLAHDYKVCATRLNELRCDSDRILSMAATFIYKKQPSLNNNPILVTRENETELTIEIKKDELSTAVWPLHFSIQEASLGGMPQVMPSFVANAFLN